VGYNIRKVIASDVEALKKVLDSSGLFPSEYLREMISEYLSDPASEEIWFTYLQDGQLVGLGYCVPEKLTDGTYNLLAIAVDKISQGSGIGSKMLKYLEDELKRQQKRILIVDTSSSSDFVLARSFYVKAGYTNVATIKDFWKDGEDKVTFYKRLL
jgi:ribosomal protein S18 acetylase RimI-like enzyme